MDSTAITAPPFSYSNTCDTFRPRIGQAAATRTGLGGKRFIHFFIPCAIRNRLVRKHLFEGMPASVKDAFCHAGFGKFRGRHIADHDVIKVTHDLRGSLVQKIGSAVGNLRVNIGDLLFLSGPLGDGKPIFKVSVMARVLDLLPSGQRGKIGQAKINAYAAHRISDFSISHFDNDIQKPVAAPILRKACSVLDLAFWQVSGMEHAERISGKPESIAVALQITAFKRNPSERTLAAITKIWPVELLARLGVLLADGIDRAGVDAKFLAAARSQDIQIKPSRPALAPLERVFLRVVAEIPDEVNRPRLLVQQAVQGLHAVAVNLNHFWRFRYASMARRMCSATESPVFSDKALSAAITPSGRNKCVRFMHTLYLYLNPVQDIACAPFLPGLKAEVSWSI